SHNVSLISRAFGTAIVNSCSDVSSQITATRSGKVSTLRKASSTISDTRLYEVNARSEVSNAVVASGNRIGSRREYEGVSTQTTGQVVGTSTTGDDVVTAATCDNVVAAASHDCL